ncbi:hypothetical protein RhiJN_08517 [Ceratobasidium sp. AG-Ba]|nr:hypothetical protein RhiJN_08517 [Ceratobasidium sp. AG-Ba]QRW09303.1 hypothetical protein RhiLY_08302 [Ceratobasidium sp. AG-Ba]
MSNFPFNENVSLLYLEHVPGNVPEVGGMYATMPPEGPAVPVQLKRLGSGEQKVNSTAYFIVSRQELKPCVELQWKIVPKQGGGYTIECYLQPPVGLPVAWNNEGPKAGTPIKTYAPNDASLYDVNIEDRYGEGWIISISPKDDYVMPGQSRFVGGSGEIVEIRAVPFYENPPPHPGWFVTKA